MRMSDWSSDVCSSDLFDLDGKNTRVTDAETFRPDVLCHEKNLSSVRVEEAAGLVFISMADDVPSLAEYLGPVLPMLELYAIDKMYVVQHKRSAWGANRSDKHRVRKEVVRTGGIR